MVSVIFGVLILIFIALVLCTLALWTAIFLKVHNGKLASIILYLEFMCYVNPKIKILAFLLMINEDLKNNLATIVSTSDKELLCQYKKNEKTQNLSKKDIKQIKIRAQFFLKKSVNEELIEYDEIEEILSDAGLLNYYFSIKRSVQRYSSFEQQELWIDSAAVDSTYKMLRDKSMFKVGKEFQGIKKSYLTDSFENIRKGTVDSYVNLVLLQTRNNHG